MVGARGASGLMLVRGIAVTGAAQLVQLLANTVTLILLARLLDPSAFGTFALLTSILTLASVAVSAGPQAGLLIMSGRESHAGGALHRVAVLLSLAGGVLGLGLVLWAGEAMVEALAGGTTVFLLIVTVLRLGPTLYSGLLNAALIGGGRLKEMATVSVAVSASSLAAPVSVLVSPEDPLRSAVIGALAGSVLHAACAIWVGSRSLGFSGPTGDLWPTLVRIAVPLHLGTVAYWVMLRADLFVVNALASGASLGIYAFALSLAERVSVVAAPIYNAAASRVSSHDSGVASSTSATVIRLHVWIAAALILVSIVAGSQILAVLGGPEYRAGAVPFVLLIAAASVLPVWGTIGLLLVSQHGRAWLTTVLQVAAALLAFALYAWLVPLADITGAAIGSVISYTALALAGLTVAVRLGAVSLDDLVPRTTDVRHAWDSVRALIR